MSQLPDDDVIKLRQLLRREAEEAGVAAQQAGPAAMMAVSAEASRPARAASRPSGWTAVPEQARRRAMSRGPAWLHRDPSAAHTKDFSALPATAQPGTGRHRQVVADVELADLSSEMHLLSGGSIQKTRSGGPVLAPPPPRRLRRSTFTSLLRTCDRIVIAAMSVGWAACVADFWVWWLEPSHQICTFGTVLNSLVLIYLTCYPVFFVLAVNHLRSVSRSVAVPLLRTAFVVARAPSEPWDVAKGRVAELSRRRSW